MAGGRFLSFFLFAFLSVSLSQAQDKYAVHFKYKSQKDFSISNPEAYLSSRALERRNRHEVSIDSLDLPVATQHILGIQPLVEKFFFHSSWLNASVILAKRDDIERIRALPFVEKVVYLAPGPSSSSQRRTGVQDKFEEVQDLAVSNTNTGMPFDVQNQMLGIPEMHQEGFKGKGITIAVLDGGFPGVNQLSQFSHLFTNNQLLGTRNFVDPSSDVFRSSQHGTNVLSLMAVNDPQLLVAAAPESNYILCLTEEVPSEYRIEEYNWAKAAEYADSLGVDIINSSLGYWDFDDVSMNYRLQDLDGKTAVISIVASIAAQKGILVVTSAGNYGSRGASSITAPADAKGILAIGSVNALSVPSSFSSQGPTADGRIKPELTARGEQTVLLRSNGVASASNGTSFSSPQVAALAAGIWQANPDWKVEKLISRLLDSGSRSSNPDNSMGYGIPNFKKAHLGVVLSIPKTEEFKSKVFPNPVEGDFVFLEFGDEKEIEILLFDLQGKQLMSSKLIREDIKRPFTFEVQGLTKGVYLLEVQSQGKILRTKLLKK